VLCEKNCKNLLDTKISPINISYKKGQLIKAGLSGRCFLHKLEPFSPFATGGLQLNQHHVTAFKKSQQYCS